jgi:hypothetical protein
MAVCVEVGLSWLFDWCSKWGLGFLKIIVVVVL